MIKPKFGAVTLLRRLLIAGPPAFLVSVLAHVLGLGSTHPLGGSHGSDALWALGTALVLLLVTGCLAAAAYVRGGGSSRTASSMLGSALLGRHGWPGFTGMLGAGGCAGFLLLELSEGRAPLASLTALLALPVAAAVVALLVWLSTLCLGDLGASLERASASSPDLLGAPLVEIFASAPRALDAQRSRNSRGRAPPFLLPA